MDKKEEKTYSVYRLETAYYYDGDGFPDNITEEYTIVVDQEDDYISKEVIDVLNVFDMIKEDLEERNGCYSFHIEHIKYCGSYSLQAAKDRGWFLPNETLETRYKKKKKRKRPIRLAAQD